MSTELPATSGHRLDMAERFLKVTQCKTRIKQTNDLITEIFSMVILSLLLIQEGQLSVSGKRMCTILVNHLED